MAAGCVCLPRVPGQLRRAGRGGQPLLGRKALHPHRSGQNLCSLHVRLTLSALAIALCRISRPGALTPRFASSVAAVRRIVGCWLPCRRQTLPTGLVRGRWQSRAGQRRPLGYLRLRAQGATPPPPRKLGLFGRGNVAFPRPISGARRIAEDSGGVLTDCSRAERRTAGAQRDHSDDRCGGRRCGRVAGRVEVDRHLRARRGCRGPCTVLRRRAAAPQVRAWPARALRSARGACSAMRALPRIPPLVPLRLAAPAVCRDARHRCVAAALDVRITRCGAGALRSQAEVRHAGRGWPGRCNRRSLGGARLDVRGAFRCRPPCAVLGPRAARHALRRAPATRTVATVH
jgi:hypothetical protein